LQPSNRFGTLADILPTRAISSGKRSYRSFERQAEEDQGIVNAKKMEKDGGKKNIQNQDTEYQIVKVPPRDPRSIPKQNKKWKRVSGATQFNL